MSMAPQWLDDIIGEFGQGAGLEHFTLGERGVATLEMTRGMMLSLEYSYPRLSVVLTVAVRKDTEVAKKVLQLADPGRRGQWAIRSGLLPHSNRAFFAVILPHDMVTLPVLTTTFTELCRLAERFAGGAE